ncbi:hypothetical protein PRIPAC_92255 [Pristionchus pacificus]|uniref:Uncharacterized protein n=1 Tax=Pristionchus pacificus TaxID=54126 RepID=A0A2A6CV54_PRIPA|nr:hypothetical protein PRIPAC_92255 [Pristionchus pacificus]|eukprot:PDM81980.1 hypothetical protein PRIPAC_33053 [Pristionchus pacificus]
MLLSGIVHLRFELYRLAVVYYEKKKNEKDMEYPCAADSVLKDMQTHLLNRIKENPYIPNNNLKSRNYCHFWWRRAVTAADVEMHMRTRTNSGYSV